MKTSLALATAAALAAFSWLQAFDAVAFSPEPSSTVSLDGSTFKIPVISARTSEREIVVDNSHNTQCNVRGDWRTRVHNGTDQQMHAFRRDDGKVQFFASNHQNFSLVGDTLDTVRFDNCRKVYDAPHWTSDPADFKGYQWLLGAYKDRTGKIVGFVHNEFHGERFLSPRPEACTTKAPLNCWYASTLLAETNDGGRSFRPAKEPNRVLATLPFTYQPAQGHVGYASPTLSRGPKGDSRIYLFVFAAGRNLITGTPITTRGGSGSCVMRGTADDPGGWRMWGGSAFDVAVANPYAERPKDPDAHRCELVLPFLARSVKYLPDKDVFVAIGADPRSQTIIYAASRDLVKWSPPRKLVDYVQKPRWAPGRPAPTEYYSLLDPTSSSRNFDTLEKRPYIYFQELIIANGRRTGFDRIVRVPLDIE